VTLILGFFQSVGQRSDMQLINKLMQQIFTWITNDIFLRIA